MLDAGTIERINELARKQRETGLSDAEKDEQARLRRLYIDHIKGQVKDQLDASGHKPKKEGCGCGCGHSHHHH